MPHRFSFKERPIALADKNDVRALSAPLAIASPFHNSGGQAFRNHPHPVADKVGCKKNWLFQPNAGQLLWVL